MFERWGRSPGIFVQGGLPPSTLAGLASTAELQIETRLGVGMSFVRFKQPEFLAYHARHLGVVPVWDK